MSIILGSIESVTKANKKFNQSLASLQLQTIKNLGQAVRQDKPQVVGCQLKLAGEGCRQREAKNLSGQSTSG
jgi:hypothetical protein